MKLPGAVRTGVRGLALMPSIAAAESQKMQAISQAGQIIGGTIDKIAQERTNEELRQLNLSMMKSQAELDLAYDKPSYSAGEIPEGVDVRLNDTQVVNGVEQSVPRQDIPAYEVKAQIYQQEMTKNINAGAERISNKQERTKWLEEKQALVEVNTAKLLGQAEQEQREYNALKLNSDIEQAIDTNQFDVAMALTGDIKNNDARVAARKGIKTAKELTTYDTLALTKDDPESWPQLEQSIETLRDPEQQSMLTTEQRVAEASKLERALVQGKQDYAIAQKSMIANAAADVKVDLDKGSIDYTEQGFKEMRDKGALTNSQYIGYTKQLADNQKTLQESQKAKFEIQAGYINTKNKQHMKAVDEEFTSLAQSSDPWQATNQIVTKYNVLPPAVNNAFEMANITGGENLTSAANQYNLLNETNPVAMMDVKAPRVQQVAAYMGLGMSSGQALEALALNESLSPTQIETRKAMVSGRENMEESTDALSSMYSDSFGSWFSTPDTPVFMSAEFAAATEANLPKAGFDIDVARKMAFNTIKGKYAPTEINGSKQVLPYMPQQPDELVRKQIVKQLGKDVIIQSDQLTENQYQLGNELSYMAYKDLGDDNIEMLDRFKYDPQAIQDAQAKEQEAKQQKAIEDAIKEREKIEAEKLRKKEKKEKAISMQKSYASKVKKSQEKPLSESFGEAIGL